MKIIETSPGSNLLLGRQGENNAREIVFSIRTWIDEFGTGTVQLLHRRKGDQDPYPVAVTQENDVARWLVSEVDTSAAGDGEYELHYYSGDTLVKSATGVTFVESAMTSSANPPDPYKGWVDQVVESASEAAESATKANEAATKAGAYMVRANEAAEKAEAAAKDGIKTVNGQAPDEDGNVEIDIPSGAFVVHGTYDGLDKTNAEIYEAYLQKRPIYGVFKGENADSIFSPVVINKNYALFVHQYNGFTTYVTYRDNVMSWEEIPTGGSGEAFVIHFTEGGLDKTNAEIYEAFTQNRPIYLCAMYGENYVIFNPVEISETFAVFTVRSEEISLIVTLDNGQISIREEIGGGSGGNVDLTGYAKEQWVKDNYQPKGNYLTEVPDGYAKTADIPTKPEDIGAQPAGNYALKSEIPTVPVQSVNGKTGAVKLSASDVNARPDNWMPTAQEVGALPSTYTPPNQTAEQVGADPKGTASAAVSQHNVAEDSHNDIRLELKAINDKLTAFFDSDNQTLDELSEIVAYITNNKTLIDSITTSKVNVADIINNLTTNVSNKPLSAAQGVALKALIDAVSNSLANYQPKGDYALASAIPTKVSHLQNDSGFVTDAVRYVEQTLTDEQQTTALENIGAVSKAETFNVRQTNTPDYTNLFAGSYTSSKKLTVTGDWTNADGYYVSDYIPVKKGDIIRIKDPGKAVINNDGYVALYTSPGEIKDAIGRYINTIQASAAYGIMTVSGDTVTWDTSNISYYSWNNFAYMRVTVRSVNSVITVNEELTSSVKEELVLKPSVKVPKESIEEETSGKPLAGKTVVCFGDSLFGMERGDDSAPAFIADETGATVHNVGFGGCRMSVHHSAGYAAFSMWALAKAIAEKNWTTQDSEAASGSSYFPEQLALLKSIDFSNVDIAVIHYGTNDFGAGNAIALDNAADHDDYTTLCGALRYSIEKLLGAYPKLRIFISLPAYRYWTESGSNTYAETYIGKSGKTLPEFVEALRTTAAEYNLPVIDSYYGLGINKANAPTFLSDGTHHNASGRERFGRYIGQNLIAQQTSGKSGESSGGKGLFYIEGNSTTDGVWTGSHNEITSYYDGLVIAYKTNIAGVSGGTTLNINGLGAMPVYRNASTAVTTIYPAGTVLILTYSGGAWLTADYDANTKNSAGTSNKTGTKMYLVGATSQTSSGTTTYTNTNAYIGTDNCLYSGGSKVYTANDLTAIVNSVIAALPVYEGEVV